MIEKGIVILGFGKRGYAFASWNLAKSIKYHSPNIHITFFSQNKTLAYLEDRSCFDEVVILEDGYLDPAKVKISLLDLTITPFLHFSF